MSPEIKPQPRRLLLALLAGAGLLANCRPDPPEQAGPPEQADPPKPSPVGPYSTTLRYDRRYIDSTFQPPPYSQGVLRQIAIEDVLDRLRRIRRYDSLAARDGRPDTARVHERYRPKVSLLPDGRFVMDTAKHYRTFPNRAAELADIRRKVDSLEALERTSPWPLPR